MPKSHSMKILEVNGKKIRRQYFTFFLFVIYVLMFFLPYSFIVFSINLNKFDLQEWIMIVWYSISFYFCLSLPFIILKILNYLYFGKVVCVLTKEGVNYRDGFIEYKKILKVEYVIDHHGRYRYDPKRKCRAVICTKNETIELLQAPYSILRDIKRINPQIKTMLSKRSKWLLAIVVIILIVTPFLILFFK